MIAPLSSALLTGQPNLDDGYEICHSHSGNTSGKPQTGPGSPQVEVLDDSSSRIISSSKSPTFDSRSLNVMHGDSTRTSRPTIVEEAHQKADILLDALLGYTRRQGIQEVDRASLALFVQDWLTIKNQYGALGAQLEELRRELAQAQGERDDLAGEISMVREILSAVGAPCPL